MPSTPASANFTKSFDNKIALVVNVTLLTPSVFFNSRIKSEQPFRTNGSPPVILNLSIPSVVRILHTLRISSYLKISPCDNVSS